MSSNRGRPHDVAALAEHPSAVPPDGPLQALPEVEGARAVTLAARRLNARLPRGAGALQDVSLHIPPASLVAVTGPQGAGQALLLAVLAGVQRPAKGQVEIDGISLFDHRKAFIPRMGYVHARAPAAPELTVSEFLSQVATLRLPRGTTSSQKRRRIGEVLAALDLQDAQHTRMGVLSPALRWRTLVAAELIAAPSLLLIDEPADNVDPGAQLVLTELLRRVNGWSGTVIMATHSARAICMADRVIVLAPQGCLAWYGPPDEAVAYFDGLGYRPAGPGSHFDFDDIDALLVDPQAGAPVEWAVRYRAQPAYKQYVEEPLFNKHPDLLLDAHPMTRFRGKAPGPQPPPPVARAGLLQQFAVYLGRTFKLFLRDRWAVALACLLPFVVAAAWCLLVSPQMYDPMAGDAIQATAATAVLAFSVLLTAALAGSRAILKDQGLPRRTAQVNLPVLPFILTKLALMLLIAIFQALVWTSAFVIGAGLPTTPLALPQLALTLLLAAFAGATLGLVASALARTAAGAAVWVCVLLLPQLIFSGGVVPGQRISLPGRALAALLPARYTFEALATASNLGGDLAAASCWTLPADQRTATPGAATQSCPCTGDAAGLNCDFPGIRQLAGPALNQSPPVQPVPDPIINTEPIQPAPGNGETLEEYVRAVNSYTLQLEIYHGSLSSYINGLRQYIDATANWQRQNGLAVGEAETVIAGNIAAYGPIYNVDLVRDWLILLATSILLAGVVAGIQIQKGKGPG